jgi:hypothetical protein
VNSAGTSEAERRVQASPLTSLVNASVHHIAISDPMVVLVRCV